MGIPQLLGSFGLLRDVRLLGILDKVRVILPSQGPEQGSAGALLRQTPASCPTQAFFLGLLLELSGS